MTIAREAIFAAHFTLLQSIGASVRTYERIVRLWTDVGIEECPYIAQAESNESHSWPRANLEDVMRLEAKLYLYVKTQEKVAPGTVLNPIMDAIQKLYAPSKTDPNTRFQTLGGLVKWARINGEVLTSEGTLGTTAVAIIPVELAVTSEMA